MRRDGQLHEQTRSICSHCLYLDPPAKNDTLAGAKIMGESSPMLLTQLWRDDQRGEFLAHCFCPRVAKHRLRRRIPFPHFSVGSDDDDCIQG